MSHARGIGIPTLSALRVGARAVIDEIEAGAVVFNSISGEYSAEFSETAWGPESGGLESGVMFKMDGGALVFLPLDGHTEDVVLRLL